MTSRYLRHMQTVADLLTLLEEQKTKNIEKLAEETEIPKEVLHLILKDLDKRNLVKYNDKTGEVTLPAWLLEVNEKIEKGKAPAGEVILPKCTEVRVQDIVIGNFTSKDLALKIRLRARIKEIAICDLTEP